MRDGGRGYDLNSPYTPCYDNMTVRPRLTVLRKPRQTDGFGKLSLRTEGCSPWLEVGLLCGDELNINRFSMRNQPWSVQLCE